MQNPDFNTPDFNTPDFNTPDFNTPDFNTLVLPQGSANQQLEALWEQWALHRIKNLKKFEQAPSSESMLSGWVSDLKWRSMEKDFLESNHITPWIAKEKRPSDWRPWIKSIIENRKSKKERTDWAQCWIQAGLLWVNEESSYVSGLREHVSSWRTLDRAPYFPHLKGGQWNTTIGFEQVWLNMEANVHEIELENREHLWKTVLTESWERYLHPWWEEFSDFQKKECRASFLEMLLKKKLKNYGSKNISCQIHRWEAEVLEPFFPGITAQWMEQECDRWWGPNKWGGDKKIGMLSVWAPQPGGSDLFWNSMRKGLAVLEKFADQKEGLVIHRSAWENVIETWVELVSDSETLKALWWQSPSLETVHLLKKVVLFGLDQESEFSSRGKGDFKKVKFSMACLYQSWERRANDGEQTNAWGNKIETQPLHATGLLKYASQDLMVGLAWFKSVALQMDSESLKPAPWLDDESLSLEVLRVLLDLESQVGPEWATSWVDFLNQYQEEMGLTQGTEWRYLFGEDPFGQHKAAKLSFSEIKSGIPLWAMVCKRMVAEKKRRSKSIEEGWVNGLQRLWVEKEQQEPGWINKISEQPWFEDFNKKIHTESQWMAFYLDQVGLVRDEEGVPERPKKRL